MKIFSRSLLLPLLCWLFPQLLRAQTADFSATPSADCATASGCTSFTVTIGGVVYQFSLSSSDAGGSMQWLSAGGGSGGSGSMDVQSGTEPNTASTEKVTITRQDGLSFNFSSLYAQNNLAETVTIQGYLNNAPTGSAQTVAKGQSGVKNFSNLLVDRVELSSTDFFYFSFDDFTVSSCTPASPSFSANTVCSGSATTFTDASTNVSPSATYAWDFDNDGITDDNTVGTVSHTYAGPGTFTASLTITQGGCSNSVQQQVTVKEISTAPIITSAACTVSASLSGTSAEADGTSITVYKNGSTQVGTGTVSSHAWTVTITGINAGDQLTAVAQASGECPSAASNSVPVTAAYTYYQDNDGDGFGNQQASTTVCDPTPPAGYVSNATDCDDNKLLYADVDGDGYGSTVKVACGGVENNNDCNDGDGNEQPGQTWYIDADGDQYSGSTVTQCARPANGYLLSELKGTGDCNDADATIQGTHVFYADLDGDGFGDPNNPQQFCSSTPPAGYVTNNYDSNDADGKTQIYVCHKGKTMVVNAGAAPAHLAHGDLLGGCVSPAITNRNAERQPAEMTTYQFNIASSPNPFAHTTRIRYSVPVDARVNIKVYDLAGRLVGVVYSGEKKAGNYSVDYNPQKLASGMYYCQMTAIVGGQAFVQTQKLIKTN